MLTLVAVAHKSLADHRHIVGRRPIDEICEPVEPLPGAARDPGRRGRENARERFVTPRYLRDYLRIFSEVLDG